MRLLAAAAAVLLLAVPALAETNVGVTAAVNQSASGSVGSNVRIISLGDSVIYNERIQTGGDGLVQILLADGTTFMVGPNSDLVIDSFVYDPNAGTAQVTASFTKGVLRFIGGQTSKTEGGVTLNTPVGTMGIRGAMVDVVLDPPAGTPQHIDMLFGNEVTLEQGQQLLGRLYAAGYSLVLGEGGTFDVMKTPPGWGSQIQAALAGKPGTKGGAPKGPTEDEVGKSEFAENNQPDDPPGLSESELKALLEAAAHYDELRNFILNNQTPQGFVGGVIVDGDGGSLPLSTGFQIELDGEYNVVAYNPTLADLAFDADGNPVAIEATFLGSVEECGDDCTVSIVYRGDGTSGEVLLTIPGEDEPLVIEAEDNFLYRHDDPRLDNPMLTPVYDEGNPDIHVLADTLDCNDCNAFVKWGFWGFSLDGNIGLSEVPGNADYMGTYITGDLTTAAQLNTLAEQSESINTTATYFGDAVGVVHNEALEPEWQDYVATGDLQVDWSFGARAGTVYIDAFDEQNANYYLSYDVTSPTGATGFVGTLDTEAYDTFGTAQGAFVNNGSDIGAGVIGSWDFLAYQSGDPVYSASGIFMGERGVIDP